MPWDSRGRSRGGRAAPVLAGLHGCDRTTVEAAVTPEPVQRDGGPQMSVCSGPASSTESGGSHRPALPLCALEKDQLCGERK